MPTKRIVRGGAITVSVCGIVVAMGCTEFGQQVAFNPCDLRQLPPDYECRVDAPNQPVCEVDAQTGVARAERYLVKPKVAWADYVTPNVHAYNVEFAKCAVTQVNGGPVPTLVEFTSFFPFGQSSPVVQLEAYQGHDETQLVRASFRSGFAGFGPFPYPGVGALEWALQAEDLNTLQFHDVAVLTSPAADETPMDGPFSSFNGELSAYVPSNTRVRLELRRTSSDGDGILIQVKDARIFAPICVRSSTPPYECL